MKRLVCSALLGSLATACAIRLDRADHYFGPTFYRAVAPPKGKAFAVETATPLVSAEAGLQWGLAIGWTDRIVASPEFCGATRGPSEHTQPSVEVRGAPADGGWHFSPLHLAVDRPQSPMFLARSVAGVHVAAGTELVALGAGYASRRQVLPDDDAYYEFSFDSRNPRAMELRIWSDAHPGLAPIPLDLETTCP